jgi:ribonuclease T2
MEKYWINNKFQTEEFWEVGLARSKTMSQLTVFQHEWSEHGTCYNTLLPSCLPPGSPRGAEAVAYFTQVVKLFQQLPTYQWLAAAGITPDSRQEYEFDDIISALREASGVRRTRSSFYACADRVHPQVTPAISCKSGAIQEINWYFYLKGSVMDGQFIPIGKRNGP